MKYTNLNSKTKKGSVMKNLFNHFLLFLSVLMINSCNHSNSSLNGTDSGDPVLPAEAQLNFSVFDPTGISNITLCLSTVNYYTNESDATPAATSIITPSAALDLDSNGTGRVIPRPIDGIYKRIELALTDTCPENSLNIINNNGTYNSLSNLFLSFTGTINSETNTNISLDITNFIDEFKTSNSMSDIETVTTNEVGTF